MESGSLFVNFIMYVRRTYNCKDGHVHFRHWLHQRSKYGESIEISYMIVWQRFSSRLAGEIAAVLSFVAFTKKMGTPPRVSFQAFVRNHAELSDRHSIMEFKQPFVFHSCTITLLNFHHCILTNNSLLSL